MTAAESAAFERFIAAVRSHPIALTYEPTELDKAEATARRIVGGGMTRAEAVHTVEALDTPEERMKVRELLAALVSTPDAKLLTEMLLARCQEALAKPDEPVVVEPQPEPPDSVGPRIVSVKDAGGEHISVTVEGWESWPSKGSKGKTVRGRLCIGTKAKPSGEMVDYMTGSQMKGGRKTMGNAFGSGEHSLDVSKGETVQVWVESLDKKQRTQKVPFVWPWKST